LTPEWMLLFGSSPPCRNAGYGPSFESRAAPHVVLAVHSHHLVVAVQASGAFATADFASLAAGIQ